MTERVKQYHGSARMSFKQPTSRGDVFYTFEFGETIESIEGYDVTEGVINPEYEKAKIMMWERIDKEINKKVDEVVTPKTKT